MSFVLSQPFDDPKKECVITIAVDSRYRLNTLRLVNEKYTGNSLLRCSLKVHPSLAVADNKIVIVLTKKIRAAANDIDQAFFGGYLDMLHKDLLCFTNAMIHARNNPNSFFLC